MAESLTDEQLAEIEARHGDCTDETRCYAHRLLAEVRRQRKVLDGVRAAWEPYEDDAMGQVPWRLQRDMNAALGEA